MSAQNLAFLCGMPRSATTWLGRTLDGHSELSVFGESDYWGRSYLEPDEGSRYGKKMLKKLAKIQAVKDWVPTTDDEIGELADLPTGRYGELVAKAVSLVDESAEPKTVYRAICNQIVDNAGGKIAIDKTPGHLLFVNRILSAVPDGLFIVVGREPFGFIASLTHRKDRKGLLAWSVLRRLAYHPAITAVMWRRYARELLSLRPSADDRFLFVDYRDVQRDPQAVVAVVCKHLGVNPSQISADYERLNSSFRSGTRAGPPRSTEYWLNLFAGKERQALYPDVAGPVCRRLDVIFSWLLLVPGLLAFFLYAPRPTQWLRYVANVLVVTVPRIRFKQRS